MVQHPNKSKNGLPRDYILNGWCRCFEPFDLSFAAQAEDAMLQEAQKASQKIQERSSQRMARCEEKTKEIQGGPWAFLNIFDVF